MGLITVYFPYPGRFGYAKAIIDETTTDFFVKMGAKLTQEEVVKSKEAQEDFKNVTEAAKNEVDPDSPDKGWGRPGSYRYHENMLKTLDDMNDIVSYVYELTGRRIARRGELADIRRNALKRIKEFMKDDSQD